MKAVVAGAAAGAVKGAVKGAAQAGSKEAGLTDETAKEGEAATSNASTRKAKSGK